MVCKTVEPFEEVLYMCCARCRSNLHSAVIRKVHKAKVNATTVVVEVVEVVLLIVLVVVVVAVAVLVVFHSTINSSS